MLGRHRSLTSRLAAAQLRLEQTPGQQMETVLLIELALRRLELGQNQLAVLPKFAAEAMLNKLQLKKSSGADTFTYGGAGLSLSASDTSVFG